MKELSLLLLLVMITAKEIDGYAANPRNRPMFENFDNDPVLSSLKQILDESSKEAQKDVENLKKQLKRRLKPLKFRITRPDQLLKVLRVPDISKVKDNKKVSKIVAQSLALFNFLQKSGVFHIKRQRGASRLENLISRFPARLSRIISMASRCHVIQGPTRCKRAEKYRRPDGLCNNLKSSLWGAANIMTRRVLRPAYGDRLTIPRQGKLPSPRLVSKMLVNGPIKDSRTITDMVKTVGQFVDHDIVLTPHIESPACSKCTAKEPCFPITVPQGDHRLKAGTCLGFGRSLPVCGTGKTSILYNLVLPRENVNEITSFVDASNVYGSNAAKLKLLRNPSTKSGKLQVFTCGKGRSYPPFAKTFSDACKKEAGCTPMFLVGDVRGNENPQLLCMHIIFLRYHNKIADGLKSRNPQWSGEKIFKETKKIVEAVWQKIVFKDYLPIVLGKKLPRYRRYRSNVDPSISSEFSTAAFRFGHTEIKPNIAVLDKKLKPINGGHMKLAKTFLSPTALTDIGGTDPIIRGLYASPGKAVSSDQVVASEIREKMFANLLKIPRDLPALNIQRGRDHGIPSYVEFRKYCKVSGRTIAHFSNIPTRAKLRLKRIYKTAGAIDLWVGGILERPVRRGLVGETFRCLIEKQFLRLRDGDRHYFENPGEFTRKQLKQIQKMSLSKVICETADDISHVPTNVFKLTHRKRYKKCSAIRGIDLNYWKEGGNKCKKQK